MALTTDAPVRADVIEAIVASFHAGDRDLSARAATQAVRSTRA